VVRLDDGRPFKMRLLLEVPLVELSCVSCSMLAVLALGVVLLGAQLVLKVAVARGPLP
jgi:hypothetical protein